MTTTAEIDNLKKVIIFNNKYKEFYSYIKLLRTCFASSDVRELAKPTNARREKRYIYIIKI